MGTWMGTWTSHGRHVLRCIRGHKIYDSMAGEPYMAHFLPDEDLRPDMDAFMEEVAAFIEARERGEQAQFLLDYGGIVPDSPLKDILARTFGYPAFDPCAECTSASSAGASGCARAPT